MKLLKQVVLLLAIMLAMAMLVSVYAAGEGNIDNGGGGMGAGTGTNFWSSHDEGVRVTVIRASDGAVVSASIDLTNKHPTDIRVHFGKVSKTSYRNGAGLSARMGGYTFYNPAQSLPQIISTSRGGANLTAIKQYFTDEQVIRAIAGYVGMDFQTLTNGEYKLLLEPIAYVTFEGVRTAFTATDQPDTPPSTRRKNRRNRLRQRTRRQRQVIPKTAWYMWKASDGLPMKGKAQAYMQMTCMKMAIRSESWIK